MAPLIAFDNVPGRGFNMSVASITNGSMAMSIATYATLLKDAETKSDAQVAVLSDALELQEEMTADLLQALDVGQIIDVVV